ncbi:hypothetical protein FSP39_019317 [Pinctada imbricata]|uniref:Putative nuclease HARBI1 n=1 Tax=Pinctada imbricata TaxID=66713 RepID=A0AA88XDH0_PINIB|nr:hypothetical protein FSP39_019317 [Pinctada imbricata]
MHERYSIFNISVCSAINSNLKNIGFQTDFKENQGRLLSDITIPQFPNVLGAIDGTLIPIMGMSGDEEHVYVCRKGFHAINVQAVVDANMRFININAKFPGSTHDAYILSHSGIPSLMEGLTDGGWLLGDSGYPLKDWLLTPFISPANRKQQSYNTAHGKTRAVVERTFGVLKSRFRCLHKSGGTLPFAPLKCSKIIEACFRLHNKAIEEKVPLMQGGSVINISNGAVFPEQPCPSAQQRRLRVADRF